MRKSNLQRTVSLTALMISAFAAAPVIAAELEGGLEQITVTARKSSKSLISVPIAVTAMSAEDLAARGIRDPLFDTAAFTPGFTFDNQSVNRNDRGFKTFIVRGIVPESVNANRQAASVFIDGVPVAGDNLSGISDIQQVEIVKGPQSAYFGRSTFAGAINFITRPPGNVFSGSADVTVAEWGTTDINVTGEGPLIADKLSFRLGARSYHTDGDYSNMEEPQGEKLGERDTKSLSATLYATPSDNFTAKFFINGWKDEDGPPANSELNNTYYNCNGGANPKTTLNYFCGPISKAPEDTRVYNTVLSPAVFQYLEGAIGPGVNPLGANFLTHHGLKRDAVETHGSFEYKFADGYSLSGNSSYNLNEWAFITDTTFRNTQNMPNANYGIIPNVLPYFQRSAAGYEKDTGESNELRVTSPQDKSFKWMVGGNYLYEKNLLQTNAWGVAGFIAASPLSASESHTKGLFASAGYDFGNGFSLNGEGRIQWDTIYQLQVAAGYSAQATFRAFTPRVIAQYEPTKNLTIYTSYSEGTRPGEFNTQFFTLTAAQQAQVLAQTAVGLAVPEERIRMGELGVKGNFFDEKLRVLADIYYGHWTNRHVPNNVNLLTPQGAFQQTIVVEAPGGVTNVQGLELETTYKLTPEFTLEGTFNIAESNIRSTFCTDCNLITGNPSPVGTQLPYYPKYKGTLSATYEREVFTDVKGYIRVDAIYTGRIYDTESNVAWLVPNTRINLHVGVEKGSTRFEIYGTNINNDRVPTQLARATDGLLGGNDISLSLADKPTYGVRVTTKF